MVRSKNKHVCNPGARRADGYRWKRKHTPRSRVIEVEKLPANYVPEAKKPKPLNLTKYAVSALEAKSSRSNGPIIPTGHGQGIGEKALQPLPEPIRAAVKVKGNHAPLPPMKEIIPYVSYGAVLCKN
jgi:hypothetical protein